MVGLCGDVYFDLLETTYEEVIVDVIGEAIDCNEEHEPLLGKFNINIKLSDTLYNNLVHIIKLSDTLTSTRDDL